MQPRRECCLIQGRRRFISFSKTNVRRVLCHLSAGISILLIPFSFDFVDALCIATVLGFLSEVGEMLVLRQGLRDRSNKVAVEENYEMKADYEETGSSLGPVAIQPCSSGERTTQQDSRSIHHAGRRSSCFGPTPASPFWNGRQVGTDTTEPIVRASNQAHSSHCSLRKKKSGLLRTTLGSAMSSHSLLAGSGATRRQSFGLVMGTTPVTPEVPVHWGLALVAAVELVLSAVSNQRNQI